jgi:hypothetical protein
MSYEELRDQYLLHVSIPKHQRCLCTPGYFCNQREHYGYLTVTNTCSVADSMLKAIGDLFESQVK